MDSPDDISYEPPSQSSTIMDSIPPRTTATISSDSSQPDTSSSREDRTAAARGGDLALTEIIAEIMASSCDVDDPQNYHEAMAQALGGRRQCMLNGIH
jgi:hypothetical protein